jgi:glycosyltransferase involved in cell wall biosynthesis
MKIIAILDTIVNVGGGFNQGLNAILQMQRLCEGRFDFDVFTFHPQNKLHLKKIGLNVHICKYTVIDKLLSNLSTNAWWQIIQSKIKLVGPFEKKLIQHNCDLVYFVTPGSASAALQKLNFITTVWDLCHRDNPEFPEVRVFNQFFSRERTYTKSLSSAFTVLTDSKQSAERAAYRYGIDFDRFLPMPFAQSPFLDSLHALSKSEILKKRMLEEGYFYYPAQFWAHKNHIRILEALLLLRVRGSQMKVVFTGHDYGNCDYLKKFILQNGLQKQVSILGFVEAEEIRGLYQGAVAVIMPTYFGPTNLPPIEAWSLGVPLIYSSHLAEQAGDAALLVDPDSADELAEAMIKCSDLRVRMKLVESGRERLRFFANQRSIAEKNLLEKLHLFAARRRCWE